LDYSVRRRIGVSEFCLPGNNFQPFLVSVVTEKTREGFSMSTRIPIFGERRGGGFQQIVGGFLGDDGLPFASVLSAERITRVFAKHTGLFGFSGVYSTAMVLWAFLNQVLCDGKAAACQAAVANISSHCLLRSEQPPTADTGDYCRARVKLPAAAIRELSRDVAEELEEQSDDAWLWKNRHAKLVDGFTFTMPDTPKNQAEFPQNPVQEPGLGFPIARAVAVISLATACVVDAAMGPYAGKQTGETALLRSLLAAFRTGDVAVLDRYYCSFMMLALLKARGTDVCARLHHLRKADFRRGRRLGKYDHVIQWIRPQRPTWMDEATYQTIPETLELREVRFSVVESGRRTKTLTVVTTLTDEDEFTKKHIAELYGFRWHVELDIRSIKQNLNLNHVRCKSPKMVRIEFRTTLLAYNLIRSVAAAAALVADQQPRKISFTNTCQYILSSWMVLSLGYVPTSQRQNYCRSILKLIAQCEVGNRPGRIEPRVIKRRRHNYKLMTEPRDVLSHELRKQCT
jgi:hypothetical protein